MAPGTDFSAAPSALGYLFQVRYALVLLLRADEPETLISIEKLDDVAFEQNGEPEQLLQLKHHVINSASLTDSSIDLWKTLRVWTTSIRERSLDLKSVILSLVTTARAPANSVASMLRDGPSRNEDSALQKLHIAGQASASAIVKDAYDSFQRLDQEAQQMLISRIRVLDAAPDILRTRELLERELLLTTRPQFLTGLIDRLEGWWFRWPFNISKTRTPCPVYLYETCRFKSTNCRNSSDTTICLSIFRSRLIWRYPTFCLKSACLSNSSGW
jgi:hypothetical protein